MKKTNVATVAILVMMVAAFGCGKENQSATSPVNNEPAKPAEESMSNVTCTLNFVNNGNVDPNQKTMGISFSEREQKILKDGRPVENDPHVDSGMVKWKEKFGDQTSYWELNRVSGDITAMTMQSGTLYKGQCAKKGTAKF